MKLPTVIQPTAIILASQLLESSLQTIFGKCETASLKIAGSTVIEHVLRELQDLSFSQCFVLAGENAHQVNAIVKGLQHWGMKIEVMNYAPSRNDVLRDFSSMSQPNGLLLIEANQLRSRSIQEFLDLADKTDYLLYSAMGLKKSLGLTYLKPSNAGFIINAKPIEMNQIVINPLQTTKDFHAANMDVVLGKYLGLESSIACHAAGRQLQHWSAEVDKRARIAQTGVMIDRRCRVERNVSLNSVVLNHSVYIARNATLENTIVMPNAVISANQNIRNSIVSGDTVYQLYD
ncbi:MAG: NDP-sugar pyrophosphorylase family protein [Arenicella sp.]|jgi:NDP-sugar pyrophosphorylase family protein